MDKQKLQSDALANLKSLVNKHICDDLDRKRFLKLLGAEQVYGVRLIISEIQKEALVLDAEDEEMLSDAAYYLGA